MNANTHRFPTCGQADSLGALKLMPADTDDTTSMTPYSLPSPTDGLLKVVADRLAAATDAALQRGLDARLGPGVDPKTLEGHLTMRDDPRAGTTYYLDGQAFLRLGPLESKYQGNSAIYWRSETLL